MFDEKTEREIDRLEDMTIAAIVDEFDDSDPVAEALADYNRQSAEASSGTTKLGALLREQLSKGE